MKIWLRFLLLLFPQTTQKLNGTKVEFYFLFLIGCFLPIFVNLCLITPPVLAQTQDNIEFNADKLLGLGIRQHQTGQFEESLKSLQQALRLYQEIGSRTGETNTLLSLGETYFTVGQYLRAIAFYQQTLEIVRSIGDQATEAKTLDNLGTAYFYLGDEKQAKEFRTAAETLRKEIGNPKREAAFLGNVGITSESEGEYQDAIALYQKQLAAARESGNIEAVGDALNNLAAAYRTLGQYPQAIEFYQQQLVIARIAKDATQEAYFLNNIAESYELLEQYPQAIEVRREQLEIASKSGDPAKELLALNNLAKSYQNAGQFENAIALYQQPLEKAIKAGDRLAEGKALNNLGFALLKSGKPEEAKTTLDNAIKAWEAIRAKLGSGNNYIDAQTATYQRLQQVLIAQNQPVAALEMAEQGRIRTIVDLLRLRLDSEPVGNNLKPAPKKLVYPTIADIQKIAKEEKATFVEYSIVPDEGVYAWVIQPTGEVTFRRIEISAKNTIYPITSVEDVISSIPESLGLKGKKVENSPKLPSSQKPNSEGKSALEPKPLLQLHQLLIKPIADLLPKDPTARVIFIPQKEMFPIPFAALVDIYGNYLIQKHTILTSPSIQLLALTRQQRGKTAGGNRLVVGNPVMPRIAPAPGETPKALPPLLSAEQEAIEIAKQFNTKDLFIGNKATKAAVLEKMRKAKSVHLATYGILDDFKRQGIPGAIALAPFGSDSGLLTTAEILELYAQPKGQRLRPELVVLSVAETGKGRTNGDGILGLSASLMTVGVPTLIMPMWSAPDAPTNALMSEFYKQLKQKNDKAEALRNAMLKIKQQNPNPKDWAAFTLIGEPK